MGIKLGLKSAWAFLRHCCFRYGWYPVLLAPFLTVAMLFEVYTFLGCQFIELDVGFTPSNAGWNQSTLEIGIFNYQSPFSDDGNFFGDVTQFVEGCQAYPDIFEEQFIDGDRTWLVTRIMSYIATSSAVLATAVIWMFVLTPIPLCFFWSGVLLPSVMLAFLASASKFLFFDTSICHSALWFPSGPDSLPRTANSCSLGKTAYYGIAAGATFFVTLVTVCLKAPVKRELKQDFGNSGNYNSKYVGELNSETSLENINDFDENPNGMLDPQQSFNEEPPSQLSLAASSTIMSMSMPDDGSDKNGDEHPPGTRVTNVSSFDCVPNCSFKDLEGGCGWRDVNESPKTDPYFDQRQEDSLGLEKEKSHRRQISRERIAKMEQMQQQTANDSDDLISNCVADLEKAFNEA